LKQPILTAWFCLMRKIFYFPALFIICCLPAAALRAGSPPPDSPGQVEVIFREDFESCESGQTSRPGYWLTWTEGTGDITWAVGEYGGIELEKVLTGRGDHPWAGEWRTETIDISAHQDVEISLDVYSDIMKSSPEDRCYVSFFYQTDTGEPVNWFYLTKDLSPRQTFLRQTSPAINGEHLVFSFRASTDIWMGEEYLFRRILVTGTRVPPAPVPEE